MSIGIITRRREPLTLPSPPPTSVARVEAPLDERGPMDSVGRGLEARSEVEGSAARGGAVDLSRAARMLDGRRGLRIEESAPRARTGLRAEMYGKGGSAKQDLPPPVADPTSSAGLEASASRVAAGEEELSAEADALRAHYGIPGVGRSGMDGFVAESEGRRRTIGLLRRDERGTPRTSVALVAARLGGEDGAARRAAMERQLTALRAADPEVDLSLVVAVATRESGAAVISSSHSRVDSFHEGGLDFLGRHVREGRVRPPEGFGPWTPSGEASVNEAGAPVEGAMVPRDELLVAYGLELGRAERIFEHHVRETFGDQADAMLAAMSPAARRAWIQIAFGGPGGAHYRAGRSDYGASFGSVTALEMLRAEMGAGRATGLDDVLTSDALGAYTRVRRGRVTAAECESYDRWFFPGSGERSE